MAIVGFRWLDILEKEFDKAFVDLDLTIGELDSEEPDVVYNVRQKLCTLSSCFAQLTHKAQTIFQNSAKIEAELIHMRAELIDSKSKRELLEQELHNLLLQLHTSQLSQLPSFNGHFKADVKPDASAIKKKFEDELKKSPSHIVSSKNKEEQLQFNTTLVELKQLRTENAHLNSENATLRNSILALNSEVYGAKLAAKYLDKELAGRIQQLQLLGREMRGDVRDKLWRQLESEILLQRHKTVVRECRRNNVLNNPDRSLTKADIAAISEKTEHFGDIRTVVVNRNHGQGLGISITGGREHGVPILISELEPNGPAALSGQLYIGDAILSVNEKDLRQACHKEAVDILKQPSDECRLQVQYIAADDSDNSLDEDSFNFRFFNNEVCQTTDTLRLPQNHSTELSNTPTAPRTPDSSSCQSGKTTDRQDLDAVDTTKLYQVSPEIQKVIDSLKLMDLSNYTVGLPVPPTNLITNTDTRTYPDNMNAEINRNQLKPVDTLPTIIKDTTTDNLILFETTPNLEKLNFDKARDPEDNFNCSSISLNSENFSSPMQTSADVFLDSDSQSPKTNEKTTPFVYEPDAKSQHLQEYSFNFIKKEIYGSNETFSNTKSDQSLLNSGESCGSSPINKATGDYKKCQKKYKKKYFGGVKTLQSIFSKQHDGYSDISTTPSDFGDDLQEKVKHYEQEDRPVLKEDKLIDTDSVDLAEDMESFETTTYKYKTILPDTSPQFEENVHSILSDMFMKNYHSPEKVVINATTSRIGPKRYLRVGKALRLCPNEEVVTPSEFDLRRERLLARYVYNANTLSADGVGDPDFGTPV